MKKILYLILLFFFFKANAQRNVILIIADDLGTDYFGFNEDYVDTVDVPNIRGLLSKGVRFNNAISNPVCSNTRSGILTGRYSFRTGVGNIVGGIGGSGQLDTSEITIPRLLEIYNPNIGKANIGKWHLHQPMPAGNLLFPNVLGYDHFEGPFIGQLTSYNNWTKYTNAVASTVTNYATSENVNNALSWLNTQNSNNPFFLWLAFNAPHNPLHLPPAGLHSYTNLSGTQANINNDPKAYFKAMIQALDTEIGRLFDSLQVMNLLDSTDIIFIGDNGNSVQTAQISDLDKAKGTVYQYGVHVPFIIAGPSVENQGRVSDALVNTTDIFTTVLELFQYNNWISQIPSSKPVDSKSLMPIIKNLGTQVRPWAFCEIFKAIPDSVDAKAMRNVEYKLIRFDYGAEEFYNLITDPEETFNLLTAPLSGTALSNYNYLCNEMTTLLGSGSICSPSAINSLDGYSDLLAYPNPFSMRIYINPKYRGEMLELTDNSGQLIYSGINIESQDFSNLSEGIYFIKIKNKSKTGLKLIKSN